MDNRVPIFQPIFGEQWQQLPPVMHKHYANRPFSNDVVTVEGMMKVEASPFMRLLAPLFRIGGALVPYVGDNVPVIVHYRSNPNNASYGFDRIFHFPNKPPYHFRSHIFAVGGSEAIEFMRIGIGWRARFSYDGQKVLMHHRGYAMRLFGKLVCLPLEWIMGRVYAEEEAINDTQFRMYMDMHHPLLGKVYS